MMNLYDLLITLKTNAKVQVISDEKNFTVYCDSITALDETFQEKFVKEWQIKGGQTIEVTLQDVVSG